MLDDVPSLPGTFGPKDSTQLQSELEESDSSQTGSLCCLPLWICLNCEAENDNQREWGPVEITALTEGIERMLPRFTVYIYIYFFFKYMFVLYFVYRQSKSIPGIPCDKTVVIHYYPVTKCPRWYFKSWGRSLEDKVQLVISDFNNNHAFA